MVYPDCSIDLDEEALGRLITPFLCFLYRVANEGHALEASIGIPDCVCWFSTPDLLVSQLIEAALLLMLLTLPVSSLIDILGPRGIPGWDWKIDVRLFVGLGLTGWLEMCLMRVLVRL